ncbi:MAG: hypothetical protein HGB32_09845 [Geobacteraceae bacterium]|nr:hypothetical protein [Geobacteraceae bacterium]NTW80437.1 hypothetical protein [Geobacteraceae bacterium]
MRWIIHIAIISLLFMSVLLPGYAVAAEDTAEAELSVTTREPTSTLSEPVAAATDNQLVAEAQKSSSLWKK